MALSPLPLDDAWAEILRALRAHQNLVLVAEPGAGKTTRFPARLLHSSVLGSAADKILLLEPRRLAARAAAARIAEEQGWQIGQEVGYQVRFENRTSENTRLAILTEGLLTKKLQSNPELKGIGAVILDEFHERSLHSDLGLALLYELQQLARPDLRIIVMSATLDAEKVARYLGDAPVIKVPGRLHPVNIQYTSSSLVLESGPNFLDRVSDHINRLLEGSLKSAGDILVFLPGTREIRGVRERVSRSAQQFHTDCYELHGSLSLDEQIKAVQKTARRKLVLATNIAETSLTIDGVGTVVDSGLARVMTMQAGSYGFPRLVLARISRASATQRTGRAGRQGPGLAYRLWSKLDESSMKDFETPEILRADLCDTLMTLASQDVTDPHSFSWFEAPTEEALATAKFCLRGLNFVHEDGTLTKEGRKALNLPLHPRLAKLVMRAAREKQLTFGCLLAALLSEKDPIRDLRSLKHLERIQSDLLMRAMVLENPRTENVDRFAYQNIQRVAKSIEQSASSLISVKPQVNKSASGHQALPRSTEELVEEILIPAFADRLCRRRRPGEGSALMVGGRGVELSKHSCVETSELFLALDAVGERGDLLITMANEVSFSCLERLLPLQRGAKIVFDEGTLCVQKQTATFYRDLPLNEAQISRPQADEAFPVLLNASLERWSSHFATDDRVRSLLERIEFLGESLPAEARHAALEEMVFNETQLRQVLAKPLDQILLRHLPAHFAKRLDAEAPDFLLVPSGNRIRVHYPKNRDPYFEVRIQEIFGWREAPALGSGKKRLVIHLLGPNYRPVQVTADLKSFWQTGYAEVRKELRLRYPKHSWPEDPLTAKAEAKGRPRK